MGSNCYCYRREVRLAHACLQTDSLSTYWDLHFLLTAPLLFINALSEILGKSHAPNLEYAIFQWSLFLWIFSRNEHAFMQKVGICRCRINGPTRWTSKMIPEKKMHSWISVREQIWFPLKIISGFSFHFVINQVKKKSKHLSKRTRKEITGPGYLSRQTDSTSNKFTLSTIKKKNTMQIDTSFNCFA